MQAEKQQKHRNFGTIGLKKILFSMLKLILLGSVVLLQTLQLQASLSKGFGELFRLELPRLLLNCGILLFLNLAAKVLLQRWSYAVLLTALLTTAWSVANYYVLEYHGSPLFFSEFRSFGTALDVMGSYRFAWTQRVTELLLACLGQLAFGAGIRLLEGKSTFFRLKRFAGSCVALLAIAAGLYVSLFVTGQPKPRKTMGWTWRTGVMDYGYAAAIVEDVDRSLHALVQPEGYNPAHLDALEPAQVTQPEVYPDLIVILNESFYDLHTYLDFTTDVDYLDGFTGYTNACYGKAVITSVGGGTNNTEYELLTSNSMHLLTMSAPFNYVNLTRETKCLASYLKPLGYTSLAMHCCNGSNYSRNRAYPELGFDRVVLGDGSFTFRENGNRDWLDEDNFRDLLREYDQMGEGPRLAYLLTFQNHGGYEVNDPEYDTVHVREDFGDLTDDINEYLSSVRLTSAAFRELTERLSALDRPVIVLMLGDHAPTLINHLPIAAPKNDADSEIRKRAVPYVIWANYPADFPNEMDYVTVTDLVPALLRTASLPLSTYHQQLLALHGVMPARTLHGDYMDAAGNYGKLDEACPWYPLLTTYYEMEYNALKGGADYRRDLFELPDTTHP